MFKAIPFFNIFVTLLAVVAVIPLGAESPVKPEKKVLKGVEKKGENKEAKVEPPEERTFEQRAIDFSKFISQKIENAAEDIDITLAGKKYTKKKNPTSVNISQLATSIEGGYLKTSTDFGINLRLPNLERRWQVRFSSYDEDRESRDLSQKRVRTRERPREYGAAFSLFESLGRIKTTFQPRLLLKDPLAMNYILRFSTSAEHKWFRLVPRLDLFADADKGTGEYASLEFQFELSKRSDLTFHNTEEYRDHENFFITQHGLFYDYSLSPLKAVGSSLSVNSNNRATFHLSSLTVALAYTEEIYKELLKYSVSPFLDFNHTEHFKGKAGISLNMEVVF